MKRTTIIAALTVLLQALACTSEQSVYEKAIDDYVQTDRYGTWTDCKFKALSIEKLADITVADSLRIIKEQFEAKQAEDIASAEKNLKYWLGTQQADKPAKYAKQPAEDMFAKNIAACQQRIDSLHGLQPDFPASYVSSDQSKILAKEVKCHYSYVLPETTAAKERTDVFILTANGDKVIKKRGEGV